MTKKIIKFIVFLVKNIKPCSVAALVGIVLGSFIGVAGFGSAISGAIPLALLGAFFVLVWNRNQLYG
jgi:hypothetical protein